MLIEYFLCSNSTLPPRMHHKLTKHKRHCMQQHNELPTRVMLSSRINVLFARDKQASYDCISNRRGNRTLTIVGPADISIASLISLVSVDAAASVCCLVSSMTWAYRCWLERNTANRGLSVVPFSCTPQNPLAV